MKQTIIISVFVYLSFFGNIAIAQEEVLPCITESFDTNEEMREIGVGKGETSFSATLNAVSYSLSNIKTRLQKTYPDNNFIYSITTTSTSVGEQIEIETTIGQPNIVCNEVIMPETNRFIVYLVLSIQMPEREKNF